MKQVLTKEILTAVFVLLTVSGAAVRAGAEFIFKTDGSIVEGTVQEENDDGIIVKSRNKLNAIPRKKIIRILYSKDFQSKKVIRLSDSTTLTGYIVSEDTNNYTVREKLDSTNEQKIPKSRIASITGYEYKDIMKERGPINPGVVVRGVYAQPLRYFADRVDMGFGFLAGLTFFDFFVSGLDLGVQTGYIHFLPTTDIVDYAQIVPIGLTLAYRFRVVKGFEISPCVSGGYSYNVIYWDRDGNTRNGIDFSRDDKFEPLFTFGLELSYAFTDLFALGVGADYSLIVEKPEIMDFVAVHLDLEFRF